MADPTDNTITSSSTYRSINDSNENNIDTASKTTRRTNAIRNYTNPSSTSSTTASLGVRSYDAIAAQDGGGHTAYDPETGAYDEHYDYRTRTAYGDDATRHHRERMLPDGTYQLREVDRFDDPGRAERVHREYRNPNTGMEFVRDYWK